MTQAAAGRMADRTRPGRPRRADVEEHLRSAVLELLRTGGPAAVTVEAVAAQSGVAKTTIHRRHANRGLAAIVMDTDPAFTELFRGALRPFEEALVDRIEEDARSGVLRADVDADAAVTLFVGAYLGEPDRHGRVDDGWLDRCLEMMWATLAPRGRAKRGQVDRKP
jgi:AcrR family transcriptional regulator